MGTLSDIWSMLPGKLQFFVALSIFLYAGSTILQGLVAAWNILGLPILNALNGCYTGNPGACIPYQQGIFIFGINFADYWTITLIVIAIPLITFAYMWFGMILKKD